MKEAAELVTDLLRSSGHAVLFRIAQQFAIWHRLFATFPSRQHDCSPSSSSRMPRGTFLVSAASLTFLSYPSPHHNNPFRRSCAFVTDIKLALDLKKKSKMLAEEQKMVD